MLKSNIFLNSLSLYLNGREFTFSKTFCKPFFPVLLFNIDFTYSGL